MEPWWPDSGHQTSSKKHQTLASLVSLLPPTQIGKEDNVGEKFLKFSLELQSNPAVSKVYKV